MGDAYLTVMSSLFQTNSGLPSLMLPASTQTTLPGSVVSTFSSPWPMKTRVPATTGEILIDFALTTYFQTGSPVLTLRARISPPDDPVIRSRTPLIFTTTGMEEYVPRISSLGCDHQTGTPVRLSKATKRLPPRAWSPQLALTMPMMTRSPSTMGLLTRPP